MSGLVWDEKFNKYDSDALPVTAEKPDPTNFAMIPKLVQWTLTPYELALYVNYKQTVGESEDGKCYKSGATLAKETRMSSRQIQRARAGLEKKGYIKVVSKGKDQPPDVFIADIWPRNRSIFMCDPQPKFETVQELVGLDCESNQGKTVSLTPATHSLTKNNPQRITHKEKNSVAPVDAVQVPLSFADRHPELSDAELEAKRQKAIAESTAQTQRAIDRNREFDEMCKAVSEIIGFGGATGKQYAHMLRGTARKGKYAEYKIEGGITVAQFRRWHIYYLRYQVQDVAQKLNALKEVEKLNGYISAWIELGMPDAPPANGHKPTDPLARIPKDKAEADANESAQRIREQREQERMLRHGSPSN